MCGWLDVREVQLVGTAMREDKKHTLPHVNWLRIGCQSAAFLGTSVIAYAISKVSPEWIGASRPLPPSWRAR